MKCARFCLSAFFGTVLVFAAYSNAQQLWSGVISSGRAVNWSQAGVTGGVPARTTICSSVALTAGSGSASANTTAIQNAITSCSGKNQTVSLPAGTYYFNGITFGSSNDVTVRGQGANSTFLVLSSGASSCGLPAGICFNGPNNSVGSEQNVCDWTAGYTPGTTSITLSNCGSTTPAKGSGSNLHVGTVLMLDQVNEATDNGVVWNCSSNGQAGDAHCANTTQGGYARMDGTSANGVSMRGQGETVAVTSVSGTGPYTVGISRGLYAPNWRSGQVPQAWYGNSVGPSGDGIEDVSIDNTGLGESYIIAFFNVANDWVSGIRSLYGGRDHVVMQYSSHIVVQHSYFYQSQSHNTVSYTVEQIESDDDLILNNICQQVTDSCPNNDGSAQGNVAIYNFAVDDVYNSAGWMQGAFYQHTSGDMFNLFEGNIGPGYSADDVHGTHYFETLYRNELLGNQNAGCGSAGTNTCTAETIPIQLWAGSRYYNIVGNVLGDPGFHTHYQYNGSTSGGGSPAAKYIYSLGATGNSGNIDSSLTVWCTNQSCGTTSDYDPQVYSTILKWANYDTVTGGVRFCGTSSDTGWSTTCGSASEIPTSLATCSFCSSAPSFSNAAPTLGDTVAGQSAMPNSFYYSGVHSTTAASPCGTGLAFNYNPTLGTCAPFPYEGPDVSNGTLGMCSGGTYAGMPAYRSSQCTGGTLATAFGGHANPNAAMMCYLGVMGGPPDGSGPALTFNRASCYAPDSGSSNGPPPPPTGITGSVVVINQ